MISKKIEQFVEYGIKFTDEECDKLGIHEGDKFSFEILDDGVMMKKYSSIDIDFSEFSKEILVFLIKESCDKNLPISQVMENILVDYIEKNK